MIKVEDIYPITTKVYPPNTKGERGEKTYITPGDIKRYTKPAELEDLNRFLTGQTRYMEGVYLGDVERWLNNQPNLD